MRRPGLDVLGGLGEGMSHLSKVMGKKMLHWHLLPIPARISTMAARTPLQHLFKEEGHVLHPPRGAAKFRIGAPRPEAKQGWGTQMGEA